MLKSIHPLPQDFVGPAVIEALDRTKCFAVGSVILEQQVIT